MSGNTRPKRTRARPNYAEGAPEDNEAPQEDTVAPKKSTTTQKAGKAASTKSAAPKKTTTTPTTGKKAAGKKAAGKKVAGKKAAGKKAAGTEQTPSAVDDDDDEDSQLPARTIDVVPTRGTRTIEEYNTAWREHLHLFHIENDEKLSNTKKVYEFLEYNTLRNVPPEQRDTIAEATSSWKDLLLSMGSSKNYVSTTRLKVVVTPSGWRIRLPILAAGKASASSTGETFDVTLSYTVLAKDAQDGRDTARKVGTFFGELVNRWPHQEMSYHLRALLINEACFLATGRSPKVAPQPRYEPPSGSHQGVIVIVVHYINKHTGTSESSRYFLRSGLLPEDLSRVPKAPSNALWQARGSGFIAEAPLTSCKPEVLPAYWTDETFAAGEQFMQFWSYTSYGLVATKKSMDGLWNWYIKAMGKGKGLLVGAASRVYGNARLFNVYLQIVNRRQVIRPSSGVNKDLGLRRMDPSLDCPIKSLLASRVVPAADTAYKEYSLNPDPRFPILAFAKSSDMVNVDIAEGVPPNTSCFCTKEQAETESHPCAVCLEPTKCASLEFNSDNARVCPECLESPVEAPDAELASILVRNSLRKSFRTEVHRLDRNPDSTAHKKIFEKALSEVLETLPEDQSQGPAFCDFYVNNEPVSIPHELQGEHVQSEQRRRNPHIPSVDAVKPRVYAPGSGWLAHAPGNVVVTRAVVNNIKFIHLPGALALLAEWIQMADQERMEHTRKFVASLDDMHIVRSKIPFYRSSAGNEKVSRERRQREAAEVVAGRPIPDERGPWDKSSQKWTSASIPPLSAGNIWKDKNFNPLLHITEQYEELYDVKLPRSPDGTPYIAFNVSTDDNPSAGIETDYNRNGIAVFCEAKLQRTRWECNKRHKTVNSSYAYFAEMVRSACRDRACILGRCPDKAAHFLHLPKSLKIKHFLCLSVGHIIHKKQMILPWPAQPSDIAEREENIEIDPNINIQTWVENYGQFEYDPEHYPRIVQVMGNVTVPKSVHDRDLELPRTVDPLLGATDADDEGELSLGPTLDFDKVGDDTDVGQTDNDGGDGGHGVEGGAAGGVGAQGNDDGEQLAPPETSATPNPKLRKIDYTSTEVTDQGIDDLAVRGDRAYGMIMEVGSKVGYATHEGRFVTADAEAIGRWDADGNVYVITSLRLPAVEDPGEDEERNTWMQVRRAIHSDQVPLMVDTNSLFYSYILVDGDGRVGYATRDGYFTAEDRITLGQFNEDEAVIYDMDGTIVARFEEIVDNPWHDFDTEPDMQQQQQQQQHPDILGEQVDPTRFVDKIDRPTQIRGHVPATHALHHFVIRSSSQTSNADSAYAMNTGSTMGEFTTQAGSIEGGWYRYDNECFVITGETKHDALAQVRWDDEKQRWIAQLTPDNP